ncbi:helix-turn-helix transcriptional regulator [Actinomadura barringtoniae]|uniref:Helix-turn-helix transcriptional regulator n=1 Tax=Actinomadura barringtoniae TaxID=1427535 RepID=A0A939T6M8_9ACTN|nr:helix-turn-helix domain-containing protein [Actinomadura barringtoniae]MBO2452138.1 helix-turn-helix transcriptional regulator [Actinomadura barringtoniae]
MREPLDPDMFDELCPSSLTPIRFGDKWAGMIIRCLEDGPRRFSELRVPLRRVTPKMLTQSLRGLERDGLVRRTVQAPQTHTDEVGPGGAGGRPPSGRIEYALTPLGRSLLGPMAVACAWADEHWEELLDARESAAGTAESARPAG